MESDSVHCPVVRGMLHPQYVRERHLQNTLALVERARRAFLSFSHTHSLSRSYFSLSTARKAAEFPFACAADSSVTTQLHSSAGWGNKTIAFRTRSEILSPTPPSFPLLQKDLPLQRAEPRFFLYNPSPAFAKLHFTFDPHLSRHGGEPLASPCQPTD